MLSSKETQTKVLFLENVPNLVKHDNGNTFSVIEQSLDGLGYDFEWAIYLLINLECHRLGLESTL